MKKTILLILILITNVSALNDVNISMQSYGYDICITNDNGSKVSCFENQTIELDGGDDYDLFLKFREHIKSNDTVVQKGYQVVYQWYIFFYYFIFFVGMIITAFIVSKFIKGGRR